MASLPKIRGYQVERELGAGGMAKVYLAREEKLDRLVALKVLTLFTDQGQDLGERFMREARTAAKLYHSNIVAIHDVGKIRNRIYYMAMEYLPGGILAEEIGEGPIDPERAFKVFTSIASALDYAHGKGFIHRDVKPDNILFREDGTPVLCDFGIAKAVGSATRLTKTGMSVGTPHYMSPEQARGKKLDGRSDIYSLGVVLYEMLTGKVPFEAEDSVAVAIAHVQDPVPWLPEHLSKYQPLLDKLLAKDPARRLAKVKEIQSVLENQESDVLVEIETSAPDENTICPLKESGLDEGVELEPFEIHIDKTETESERVTDSPKPLIEARVEIKESIAKKGRIQIVLGTVLVVMVAMMVGLISGRKKEKPVPPVQNSRLAMQQEQNFKEKPGSQKATGLPVPAEHKNLTDQRAIQNKLKEIERRKKEELELLQLERERLRELEEKRKARQELTERKRLEEERQKAAEQARILEEEANTRREAEAARQAEENITARIAAGEPIEIQEVTRGPQRIAGDDPCGSRRLQKLLKGQYVSVVSRILINEKGRVARVRFKGDVRPQVKMELSQLIATWNYSPAILRGRAVKVWMDVSIDCSF